MAKHWLVFCRQAAMSIVENLPTKLKTVNNQNPQKLGKLLPQPPSEQILNKLFKTAGQIFLIKLQNYTPSNKPVPTRSVKYIFRRIFSSVHTGTNIWTPYFTRSPETISVNYKSSLVATWKVRSPSPFREACKFNSTYRHLQFFTLIA